MNNLNKYFMIHNAGTFNSNKSSFMKSNEVTAVKTNNKIKTWWAFEYNIKVMNHIQF